MPRFWGLSFWFQQYKELQWTSRKGPFNSGGPKGASGLGKYKSQLSQSSQGQSLSQKMSLVPWVQAVSCVLNSPNGPKSPKG